MEAKDSGSDGRSAGSHRRQRMHAPRHRPNLRADKDIVAVAVRNPGWSLQWALDDLRDNRGVVLLAIIQEPTSFMQFVDLVAFDLIDLRCSGRRRRCSKEPPCDAHAFRAAFWVGARLQ